jgi:hypothetical protein
LIGGSMGTLLLVGSQCATTETKLTKPNHRQS